MNFFDIVFTLIILFFIVLSASRGALRELLSTLGIIVGYFAAERFYPKYMNITLEYINNVSQAKIITYFAIFALCIIAGFILSMLVKVLLSFKRPSFFSRLSGSVMGLIKGLLICLLIFFVVEGYIPSYLDDLYASFYTPWFQELRNFINGINFALLDSINMV